MSDINTIDHVDWALSGGGALPDPVPILQLGNPTTTYVLPLGFTAKDAFDEIVPLNTFGVVWRITDPKGNIYGGGGGSPQVNIFPIYAVGEFVAEITITDTNGISKKFTKTLQTVTQYDSGGGVMRDIPLDIAGNVSPIYEWAPNLEGGYYNNGMAVFSTGDPVPPNENYQCDILCKVCRPKYLGTPPGKIDGYPVVAGTPIYHAPNGNYIHYDRIPQPLRRIPASLLAHKQSTQQSTCWCWAIKPKHGDWEGYTSLNRNIDLPEYVDYMGNAVPAMTYLAAAGVSPTTVPVRLSLAKDGVDVTVLAFDRERLERKYYVDAEFEVFEINYRGPLEDRWVAQAGFLGNTKMSDSSATVELVPWADLANRPQGRTVSVLCDVGIKHGEEFGTGRCRNQVLHDGPDKDDWTVAMTLQTWNSGSTKQVINISANNPLNNPFPATAISGATIDGPVFGNHLINGKMEFTSGKNLGVAMGIRRFDGQNVYLTNNLPYVPAAGDTYLITVGCRRTTEDCQFFNNIANFRGFPYVPGQEGVMRRYKED